MQEKGYKNMLHKMKLNESPFERIKNGTKNIEFRLFDEKRQQIKIGDQIEFSKLPDLQEKLLVTVTKLYREDTFENLFKKLYNDEKESDTLTFFAFLQILNISLYSEASIISITSFSFISYKSFFDILFSSFNFFKISATNCIEYLVLSSRYITDNLLVNLTKKLKPLLEKFV